jgi:hypothetical protein
MLPSIGFVLRSTRQARATPWRKWRAAHNSYSLANAVSHVFICFNISVLLALVGRGLMSPCTCRRFSLDLKQQIAALPKPELSSSSSSSSSSPSDSNVRMADLVSDFLAQFDNDRVFVVIVARSRQCDDRERAQRSDCGAGFVYRIAIVPMFDHHHPCLF